jgi:hypothetical protein
VSGLAVGHVLVAMLANPSAFVQLDNAVGHVVSLLRETWWPTFATFRIIARPALAVQPNGKFSDAALIEFGSRRETFSQFPLEDGKMASPLNDPKLEALLERLHAQSDTQIDETDAYFAQRKRDGTLDFAKPYDDALHGFLADKMVALDRDKGEFCYQLCRALGARRVVEAGTSYGVSTLYLVDRI